MPIISSKQLINEAVKNIHQFQTGKITPIDTGIDHLNYSLLGGLLPSTILTIAGISGCVDNKTQYFNGTEWKDISQYTYGEKVLQYHKNGTSSLVIPEEYHKQKSTGFHLMKSKYGVNQCLSDEHQVVYESSKGHLNIKPFVELRQMHDKSIVGFQGKFYNTFNHNTHYHPKMSEYEFRLAIAISADGHLIPNRERFVRINIKKKRKQIRLEKLLLKSCVKYKVYNKGKNKGFKEYVFQVKKELYIKLFPTSWYLLSNKYKNIFIDEILHWDGSLDHSTYYTTLKHNADICQFIFSSTGKYRSRISMDDREGKPTTYQVNFTKRNKTSIRNNKQAITPYTKGDGYKYCFTVPTGMIIFRRGGVITITGNSGKSYLLQRIENTVMKDPNVLLLRCNWEMNAQKLLLRKLSQETKGTVRHHLFNEPVGEELEIYKQICAQERQDNVVYSPEPVTPVMFYSEIEEFLLTNMNKKVVITVDHLGLTKDELNNDKKTIDDLVAVINRLNKIHPYVCFIVLSQLNRKIEDRTGDPKNHSPNRGDLYGTDTLYHLSDVVLVVHNPFKLGIQDKYMVFGKNRYQYLEEFKVYGSPKTKTASFEPYGNIYYHYIKMREFDDISNIKDIFVERLYENTEVEAPSVETEKGFFEF